jgi:hypothetical protein
MRQQLIDALLGLPWISNRQFRDQLLANLPRNLELGVQRSDSTSLDVTAIVDATLRWDRAALRQLINNALDSVRGSEAALALEALLAQLDALPEPPPPPTVDTPRSQPMPSDWVVLDAMVKRNEMMSVADLRSTTGLDADLVQQGVLVLVSSGYIKATSTSKYYVSQAGWRYWGDHVTEMSRWNMMENSMAPVDLASHVDALVKRINSLQGWIDEYDRMLDVERDPLRRADYTQQLERLRPRLDEAQQEYNQLQNAPGGPASPQLQQVGDKLDAMDNKLDTLLTGQAATREEIKALVVRYDAGEQKIIATIMEHVPPADLSNLQAVLDALDANRLSLTEMQTALTGIREAQDQLQQQGHSLPTPPLPDGDNPALDVRHRLKLTVPLLPLFLSYEGEVELNSGVKLKDVWADLVRKARGK